MKEEYGYCRISTPKQNIDRQERNILEVYPSAHIIKEVYTGTKTTGRREWSKLYKLVKQEAAAGKEITIIFDSVSHSMKNCLILESALYFSKSRTLTQILIKTLLKQKYK